MIQGLSRLRGGRRRGPAKRAPKDIFSPGAKKEQKKSVPTPPPRNQPISPPKVITPPKVAGSVKETKAEKKVVEPKVKTSEPEIKKVTEAKKEIATEKNIEEPSKEIIADWETIPALIILLREIAVSGLREYLAKIKVSVPVSRIAKIKTAIQLIALAFLILSESGITIVPIIFIGKLALWTAGILTLYTGYDYLKSGLRYFK